MLYAQYQVLSGQHCIKRPLTYSYLKAFVQSSVACNTFSTWNVVSNDGNVQRSLSRHTASLCNSNEVLTLLKRQYGVKVRLTPEQKYVYRNTKLGYIWKPDLAQLIREKVWPDNSLKNEDALVVDSNAGPGILSKELLNAGVKRLVSLDRNKDFLPRLEELKKTSQGRLLRTFHADFYKIQYHGETPYAPPVIRLKELFQDVSPVSWESDVPIKVLGCFPHRMEKTQAYLFASLMIERLSLFAYGRAQLNFLLSEKCYETIVQPPGKYFKYRALSALYQLGFDIKLLHKEPLSSFSSPSTLTYNSPAGGTKDSFLYLTQLTPKRDLFLRHNLSQHEAFIFVYFMRQTLSKRSSKLVEIVENWAPGHGHIIAELELSENVRSGDVDGDTLLKIFTHICKQDTFNGSWMGEDAMAYALKAIPTV